MKAIFGLLIAILFLGCTRVHKGTSDDPVPVEEGASSTATSGTAGNSNSKTEKAGPPYALALLVAKTPDTSSPCSGVLNLVAVDSQGQRTELPHATKLSVRASSNDVFTSTKCSGDLKSVENVGTANEFYFRYTMSGKTSVDVDSPGLRSAHLTLQRPCGVYNAGNIVDADQNVQGSMALGSATELNGDVYFSGMISPWPKLGIPPNSWSIRKLGLGLALQTIQSWPNGGLEMLDRSTPLAISKTGDFATAGPSNEVGDPVLLRIRLADTDDWQTVPLVKAPEFTGGNVFSLIHDSTQWIVSFAAWNGTNKSAAYIARVTQRHDTSDASDFKTDLVKLPDDLLGLKSLTMDPTGMLWAVVDYVSGQHDWTIARSVDQGKTWTFMSIPATYKSAASRAHAIAFDQRGRALVGGFIDSDNLWVVYRSDEGQGSFQPVDKVAMGTFSTLSSTDGPNVMMVDASGSVIVGGVISGDKGRTWLVRASMTGDSGTFQDADRYEYWTANPHESREVGLNSLTVDSNRYIYASGYTKSSVAPGNPIWLTRRITCQ